MGEDIFVLLSDSFVFEYQKIEKFLTWRWALQHNNRPIGPAVFQLVWSSLFYQKKNITNEIFMPIEQVGISYLRFNYVFVCIKLDS